MGGRILRRSLALAACKLLLIACASDPGVRSVHPMLEAGDTDPAAGFETPPMLRASELWPAELLRGPRHVVQEAVPTDGFARIYRIESDFGSFEALGDDMLLTRVREIHALAQLEAMSGTRDFAAAAAAGLRSPFVASWNLIRHPVDSVTGIPRKAWQEIQRTAALARSERGEFESRAFREFIGFEAKKRELAHKLGVDPYSSNRVLQRELNRLAWAGFAGDLPFRFVPFQGHAAGAAGGSGMGELLARLAPEDLRRLNRIQLAVLGVPTEAGDAFLAHSWYSPRRQTLLVEALAGLDGASGAAAFLELAGSAQSEYDALYYQRAAELLQLYDRSTARVRRLVPLRRGAGGVTEDEVLVVPLLVDHAVWTGPAARLCRGLAERAEADFGTHSIRFLISGSLSERARGELAALGIAVTDHAFAKLAAPGDAGHTEP